MIDVFLEEASASQDVLDSFTVHDRTVLGKRWRYHVSRWQSMWKKLNLWRLKLLDLKGLGARWRIVYAFHPLERRYYVLGVVPREFDYDPKHPLSRRIVAAYRELDLP